MATSGTYDFNLPIDEIIEDAYDMIGVDQMSGQDLRTARRALNLLLIDLRNRNIPLANLEKITLPLVKGQIEYTLDVRHLDIMDAVVRRDTVDLPIVRMGLFDYNAQPNKTQEGRVLNYVVDRQKDAVILSVWPVSENSTDTMIFWSFRKSQDVGNFTNDIDLANKYLPAVTTGLAYFLSLRTAKIDPNKIVTLKAEYEQLLDTGFGEDRERTSVYFTPVLNRR